MGKTYRVMLAAALAGLLAGCASAPQTPVPWATETLAGPAKRVGVAATAVPKVDFTYPGANCLLCMATASTANSKLIDYTRTLSSADLTKLPAEVADLLKKKGQQVVVIDQPLEIKDLPSISGQPGYSRRDFRALAGRYNVEKLYVIEIDSVGMERTYATYFPTSDPKAVVHGKAYLVDLQTNRFDWFQPIAIAKSSDGAWDEPPAYPGLTNAYFQALELARDAFEAPVSP